jgi:hypothetical protein
MWRDKGWIPKILLTILLVLGIFLFGRTTNPNDNRSGIVSAQAVHPCIHRINVPINELHWLYVPETADQLHTEEKLFYLAGQLISNKVVDASTCPTNGLTTTGYANACGMAVALPKVIIVQNMLNEPILRAWKEIGVPPVLLKQLIRRESQFWPSIHIPLKNDGNLEYGFGHMTYMGMKNSLFWNRNLYAKLCSTSSNPNCISDEGIVNQFLSSLVAVCPTCESGINVVTASRSVDILADSLMAHCYQTSQLIYNATNWNPGLVVDYSTIWKLTLMDYTSGPGCVLDTLVATFDMTEGPMSWSEISANVPPGQCEYGSYYADQITAKYFDFPPKE